MKTFKELWKEEKESWCGGVFSWLMLMGFPLGLVILFLIMGPIK